MRPPFMALLAFPIVLVVMPVLSRVCAQFAGGASALDASDVRAGLAACGAVRIGDELAIGPTTSVHILDCVPTSAGSVDANTTALVLLPRPTSVEEEALLSDSDAEPIGLPDAGFVEWSNHTGEPSPFVALLNADALALPPADADAFAWRAATESLRSSGTAGLTPNDAPGGPTPRVFASESALAALGRFTDSVVALRDKPLQVRLCLPRDDAALAAAERTLRSSVAAHHAVKGVAVADCDVFHAIASVVEHGRSVTVGPPRERAVPGMLPSQALKLYPHDIVQGAAPSMATASRAVLGPLTATEYSSAAADEALRAYLVRRGPFVACVGAVLAVPVVGAGDAATFVPAEVTERLLPAEVQGAADHNCPHGSCYYFRVEALAGGCIIDPATTEIAAQAPAVPTSSIPARAERCLVAAAASLHPAARTVADLALAAHAPDAPRVSCIVVQGAAVNGTCRIVDCAVRSAGLQQATIDVRLIDAPTAVQLMAHAAYTGAVVVLRGAEVLDANGELARFVVAAAAGEDWPFAALDGALPEALRELPARKKERRVCAVIEFGGTDVPPPAFASVAVHREPIRIGVPDEAGRTQLARTVLLDCCGRYDTGARLSIDVACEQLASWSVGLGLIDVVEWLSGVVAAQRSRHAADCGVDAVVDVKAFEAGLKEFQAQHGHNLTSTKLQPVKWADVGGLEEAKAEIRETIALPLQHPELFEGGGKQRTGVLMYGPPGCGKTLLAKAIATEMGLNFISVKGPELINMYVGESEKNIRLLFQRARDNSPCIVFFDELDALAPKRGAKGDSGGVMDRIVAQLLAEVDGVGRERSDGTKADSVFIVGATNRPDLLDSSLMRPGRFDRLCYLGPPANKEEQVAAVTALTRKFALADDVDLAAVVAPLEPIYSGADYFALCSDAMMLAVNEAVQQLNAMIERGESVPSSAAPLVVEQRHFEAARAALKPSVSPADLARYRGMKDRFAASGA